MRYDITFDIASLPFLLVVLLSFYCHSRIPSLKNKFFSYLLITISVQIALDILTAYTIEYAAIVPLWLNYLLNMGLYLANSVLPVMLYLYVLTLSDAIYDLRRFVILSMLPIALILLTLFTNSVSKIYFYFDENLVYTHGKLYPLMYVCAGMYMLLTVVASIIYRFRLERQQFRTLLAISLIISAVMILQVFVTPYLILSAATSLAVVMMYLTLQNPGDVTDSRTNVFNRVAFSRFSHEHRRSLDKLFFTLVIPDDMQMIRSVCGEKLTDELLQSIAVFLSRHAERVNVYRLSEDAFAVVSKQELSAEGLRDTINARFERPWVVGSMSLSVSVRVCTVSGNDISQSELIPMLDKLSERALARNGGTELMPGRDLLGLLRREIAVVAALHEAVERDLLEVWFQPIYSQKEGRFVCAEALSRFPHSELGMIPPSEFIPVAEKNGLIVKIGSQVREKVCRAIANNSALLNDLDYIGINLSVAELMSEDLLEDIAATTRKHGVDTSRIRFEITESAASTSNEVISEKMTCMAERGYKFILDDFGTGYANIDSIIELPFCAIKLAREMFLAGLASERSAVVFENSVELVKRLEMICVVEGIETATQAERMRKLGIDLIQGYFYAVPMREGDFLSFLRAEANGRGGRERLRELRRMEYRIAGVRIEETSADTQMNG